MVDCGRAIFQVREVLGRWIKDPCGLNITVWSYAGNMNFSLMGCKKAIPDIDRLADGLEMAMNELREVCARGSQETEHVALTMESAK